MNTTHEQEKRLILVAEDEQDLREALVTALQTIGEYEVVATADGEEALREALDKHPDLILLDIQMPKMNGGDVLKNLRADEWGKNVPVIILTAQSDLETMSEAIAVGGVGTSYFTKSDLSLAQVVETVKNKLAK